MTAVSLLTRSRRVTSGDLRADELTAVEAELVAALLTPAQIERTEARIGAYRRRWYGIDPTPNSNSMS